MAKDDKPEEQAAETGAPPEKKKGLMKWVIVGVLSLVLLGGGGFAAWKFLSKDKSPEVTAKAKGKEAPMAAPGPIVPLDSFLVNLADPADSHYLKVTVNLEVEKADITEEIQQRIPQIRDSILVLLSSKTAEDVRTVEGKFRL